jgi:hypothetical protein
MKKPRTLLHCFRCFIFDVIVLTVFGVVICDVLWECSGIQSKIETARGEIVTPAAPLTLTTDFGVTTDDWHRLVNRVRLLDPHHLLIQSYRTQ